MKAMPCIVFLGNMLYSKIPQSIKMCIYISSAWAWCFLQVNCVDDFINCNLCDIV